MTEGMDDPFAPLGDEEMAGASSAPPPAWHPILPVPDEAPDHIPPHPLGSPAKVWWYRDHQGCRLFAVCRFDTADGKQTLPLTFCQAGDGRRAWKWQGAPAPRPLFQLDRLSACPNAPVLVVEGEKAAEAAALLFPEFVATTSPNGAGNASKADWSALAGRAVTIWPDHDDEGRAYADDAACRALAAGAASVSVVDVPIGFPLKWDLADPPPAGWDARKLRALLPSAASQPRAETPTPDDMASSWPVPDMSVVNEGRRPPPPLPLEIFDNWERWITATAEGCSAPVDYVAASLLAVAASLIGNARWVSPWAGWCEPCALWIGLIGGPSSSKSPAIDPFLQLIRQLESGFTAEYEATLLRWETEREVAACKHKSWEEEVKQAVKNHAQAREMPPDAVEPEMPVRPRLAVNDSTPEALAAILAGRPRGALLHRDELAGWLESFARYGNGSERAFFLEAYGGRPYVLDRVKHPKPLVIPALTISVLGGIQPDRLSSTLLTGDDDGLASRFLFTWPERVPLVRPRMVPDAGAREAFQRLTALEMASDEHGKPIPVVMQLAPEAADLFQDWREKHAALIDGAGGMLAGHFGKHFGMVLRLALVLEYLWWSRTLDLPPEAVSTMAVAGAITLADGYFTPMAQRAYGDAAVPEKERHAATVARWITKEQVTLVNARNLRRQVRLPGLSEADKVHAALDVLVEAEWLRPAPSRQGGTKGRQSSDYAVNPRVLEDKGG